jgi:hypothetical protein
MNVMRHFVAGLFSVLKIVGAPMLYRYPYRTSAEGLRADWNNIGQDIQSVMGKMEAEALDGRRTKE